MVSAKQFVLVVILITFLPLAGCDNGRSQRSNSAGAKTIQSTHYRNLIDIYNSFSYNFDSIEQGIPPLLLHQFPSDIHLIKPTSNKKKFFFQAILPMALLGNEEIKEQREAIINFFNIYDNGKKLQLHQHEDLIKIQRYYKVKGDVLQNTTARARLLVRVDTIPPALVLAQAANESGWGMSRFAQQANNIFGEWTFTPGTGLVPKGRPEGKTYEVRRFESLYASIRSYLRNLNTHSAYRSMRNTRQRLRNSELPLTGHTLAGDMQYYSTRRQAYVEEIRSIIIRNRLDELNLVALKTEAKRATEEPEQKGAGQLNTWKRTLQKSKS